MKIVRDKEGLVKVDNKIRRDPTFPTGFMDVVSLDKTGEHFRILYDTKGRYQPLKIDADEANYKLCKVIKTAIGPNKAPYLITHDGRTIRYPSPKIKVNDTIRYNLTTGEIENFHKFEQGATVMLNGGNNIGRVGIVSHVSSHDANIDIVHVRDATGNTFATRITNVFVIGFGKKAAIKLPKSKGIRLNIIEERDQREQ